MPEYPEDASGKWPSFSLEERAAVEEILISGKVNYWTGTQGRQFEAEFAEYVGTQYAVAVSNGTVALELALRAIGIGPGDEVIVTPRSFIASASVIVQVGATPVFADIDPISQNIDPAAVKKLINGNTAAIILVHLGGWPCDMRKFSELSRQTGIPLIEDCAQAHGAEYNGKRVGSFGKINAFSFCQDKIISTAGEGGMVVTDSKELWEFCWSFKDHGKSYRAVNRSDHPPGFRWLHESIGTNNRMTEIEAAVGRIQLRNLNKNIARRREIAWKYHEAFSDIPIVRSDIEAFSPDFKHSFYVYYLQIKEENLPRNTSRDQILAEINKHEDTARAGSCPEIYLEKAFRDAPARRLEKARDLGRRTIMLPCHHHILPSQQEKIICLVRDNLSALTS